MTLSSHQGSGPRCMRWPLAVPAAEEVSLHTGLGIQHFDSLLKVLIFILELSCVISWVSFGKVKRGGYSSKRRWQLGREALLELDQGS